MNQIWLAFLTGLTTGGVSCMAVQGGLLASAIDNEGKDKKTLQISAFLVAKLIAYTLLGALLGLVGSRLILSPTFQGWMQIFIGLFMLATAGRILNLHPIFRYFVIQPPKFIYKFMRHEAKNATLFTPSLLGLLTIFIPCGVTQAMMVLAVGTQSAFYGAAIMFAFTLGTSPVFFTLGYATSQMLKKKSLTLATGVVIAILAVLSVNTGQILRGSPHTLQNYSSAIGSLFKSDTSTSGTLAQINNGIQEVTIKVNSTGYVSSANTLRLGVPVKLKLITSNTQGCSRAFTIPAFNISKILPQTGEETLEFTPTQAGPLVYTCSMGMFTGRFNVI